MNTVLTPKGTFIWIICALFFLYEFFLRTVLGTFQPSIMVDMNLTSVEFSILSTAVFLIVYGMMQIPVGLIVDHVGLKKALLIGSALCTLSVLGFAYSNVYSIALFFRALMGAGASFGLVCLLVSVNEWMPSNRQALFIGLSQFIGTMGPMIAAGPLDSISETSDLDWRTFFLLWSVVGGALIVMILFFVENNQQKKSHYIVLKRPEKVSTAISRIFTRIQPWYIALLSAMLFLGIEYLSENEGRSFLALKDIPLSSASYMITLSWIGYGFGCPLLGFLSDLLERRKIIITICAAINVMAMLLILYAQHRMVLQVAFLMLGFGSAGQSMGYVITAEQFKRKFVALGFGLNNAMVNTFSAVNAPLIGSILHLNRFGKMEAYSVVFYILITVALVGFLIAQFLIKETYGKSAVEFTVLKP